MTPNRMIRGGGRGAVIRMTENITGVPSVLAGAVRTSDGLLTLGAGSIGQVAASPLQRLRERQ